MVDLRHFYVVFEIVCGSYLVSGAQDRMENFLTFRLRYITFRLQMLSNLLLCITSSGTLFPCAIRFVGFHEQGYCAARAYIGKPFAWTLFSNESRRGSLLY